MTSPGTLLTLYSVERHAGDLTSLVESLLSARLGTFQATNGSLIPLSAWFKLWYVMKLVSASVLMWPSAWMTLRLCLWTLHEPACATGVDLRLTEASAHMMPLIWLLADTGWPQRLRRALHGATPPDIRTAAFCASHLLKSIGIGD